MKNLNSFPAVYLDMDGTMVDFYGVPNWLDYLLNEDTTPYEVAAPRINFSLLARYIHKLQAAGVAVGIISWTSKNGSENFNKQVEAAKLEYLRRKLPSVEWDEIHIVPYGVPKYLVADMPDGILFDDEKRNREEWEGIALDEGDILNWMKTLIHIVAGH